ncbi:MFS transporter [Flaviflexus massiliensis]|uniref:MFS transporter n=1 Tax=Flaviflexus massiliensis TaxID=1522309 RepID=UPI0006D5AEEC|nr:MFS transporter [Flaviflexus massiliensis]
MNPLRALAAPVYIPSLIYSIGNGALQPVIVLAALDIGFGDAGSSAVLGVAGVVGVFTAPVLGSFITKVGDRRSLIIASILALVALALSGSALFFGDSTYAKTAFMTDIVALAISLNVWTLARQAYIADTLPGMWRGRGLSMLGGLLRIGVLVGPLLATGLIAQWDLGSVFTLNAITVATALALIIRYLVPISIDFEESSESSRDLRDLTGQRGSSKQRDTSTQADPEQVTAETKFGTEAASENNDQPSLTLAATRTMTMRLLRMLKKKNWRVHAVRNRQK